MKITICIQQRTVYVAGAAHYLSRTGCNRLYGWLQDNGRLLWGWAGAGEFVFEVMP